MENAKATPDKCKQEVDDGDSVFLDNRYLSQNESEASAKHHHHQMPPTYTQFLFDPRDIRFHSTGSRSHRRTPSYDSRESTKSVSECSYVSGSPCESPRFHEMSLSSFSVASSTTPAAPPDDNPFHSEKDFVNYLLTLPPASAKPEMTVALHPHLAASTSGGQGSPPQIGLNHLENLCKLMEQLGELREHNSKLQQRVQYLEEMRNLNEIRQNLKEVLEEAIATSPRVVGGEAFDFPPAKECGGKGEAAKRSASSAVKMRQSSSKRRLKQKKGRSQSMGDDDVSYGAHPMPTFHKAKVSKWTKVKEALKWERVQGEPNDGQTIVVTSRASLTLKPLATSTQKEEASEEGTKHKVNVQPVKYLQKTDTMREIIVSPGPTTTQEVYEPVQPTHKHLCADSESSADEDELIDLTDPISKRRSLGSNVVFDERSPPEAGKAPKRKPKLVKESAVTDDDPVKLRKGYSLERGAVRSSQSEKENKKLSKGAWGKVKTILQTRKDSLRRKQRKSACLDANPEAGLSEGSPNEADEVWTESATDDRAGGAEPYQSKSKHSSSSSNYGLDEPSPERVPSRGTAGRKIPPQLVIDIQPEADPNLKGPDKAESSPTFQQTAPSRGKKKDERFSGCQSVPASPSNITSFRYDDLDFLEEYFRENKDGRDQIDIRVRDRLSLAERDSGHHHHPVLLNLDAMRNLEEMQRNVTEDFTKKMQDWERLKSSYNAQKQQGGAPSSVNQPQSSPHFDRKTSSSFSGHRFRKTSKDKPAQDREQLKEEKHREKELQWLEKQLQKIEREKQRLAKERQKYLERESQLEKMRETMLVKPGSKSKKEVLVKTSAGEFRFEGISKTFTRKLHEWETMKGIGPEVSTLTLLGGQKPKCPALSHALPSNDVVPAKSGEKNSLAPPSNGTRLCERNRSHSESSLANMANVQTSTTSLVMRPDDDFNNDSELYADTDSSSVNALSCSRVNSEPEIAFGGAGGGEEVPCAIEVEQMHIEEALPCLHIHAYHAEEPVYSYAPVEVTQLIDSSSGSDAEIEVQIIEARNDEEVPQHGTAEKDERFGESRVTQIKGPKPSIKNQQVSGSKVPEAVVGKDRRKKKEGVNKVKEISAELMQQAKTLEQTLMDKNVTIRQLQWELLQREMSSKRFQSQLEQGLLSELASPTTKAKSSHQRSWSAAETVGNKREIENQSALNVLKKSDVIVANVTPIGLAQKVDELKSELNNLWSSQESNTTSICSEIGTENVPWTNNQSKSIEKSVLNTSEPQQLNGTKCASETETNSESALKSVIIRRVSDTNLPQYPLSRISKLPMSPQMNRSKSLSQNVTPTSVRKVVHAVSPLPLPESPSPKLHSKTAGCGSPYLARQSRIPDMTSGNGVKLNRQKRVETSKDASHLVLRRQNAEDFESSSDSDSESSNGVTFTINLNKSRVKSGSNKDSPSPQTIKANFSPKLRAPSSPKISSSSGATWRKNSKDEVFPSHTEGEERVSAPSTPIVRSRSTRKLKPPSINKTASGEIPAVTSDSPLNSRRLVSKDNTAPNVKLMIEKFNKKVNEVQTYTSSSPNMSRNRYISCETGSPGVKKSTSFTDSGTNFENEYSKFGYPATQNPVGHKHVVKSASAGVIEGETYKNIVSKPPLSPEVARKKVSGANSQPVGIASRIPRCLTAISEQENPAPKSPPTPPTPQKATLSDVSHSPTFGIRALEIKRAKENFLSKNPPPQTSSWRSLYHRPEPTFAPVSTEPEVPERGIKPKSILKHTYPGEVIDASSYEPPTDTREETHVRRGSMSELTEIDEPFSNQIIKSASAGAVDFGSNFGKSRIPSQASTDSADKQQKSTCGLFNFKFRRPKLKHKKTGEALPAVKALCRQSLLVDIDAEAPLGAVPTTSNSCPSSPQIKPRQNVDKNSSDLGQFKTKSIFKSK